MRRRAPLDLGEDATRSATTNGYEKKSSFVKALLDSKAKEGTKMKQDNGGRMPSKWYPNATLAVKSYPGCADIDFKQHDIEKRIRSIAKSEVNKDTSEPTLSAAF